MPRLAHLGNQGLLRNIWQNSRKVGSEVWGVRWNLQLLNNHSGIAIALTALHNKPREANTFVVSCTHTAQIPCNWPTAGLALLWFRRGERKTAPLKHTPLLKDLISFTSNTHTHTPLLKCLTAPLEQLGPDQRSNASTYKVLLAHKIRNTRSTLPNNTNKLK